MSNLPNNLRKAAILIRSLDADTAAGLLAQLTPAEAKAVRLAIQSLGPIGPEERTDVAAEFRRTVPVAGEGVSRGVELDVSNSAASQFPAASLNPTSVKPFEFLERARVESLVPYLAREHGQTVAVVLSYLPPIRAAEVLAALPPRQQAEVIERLSMLGETDANTLHVLERELADWVARQQTTRTHSVTKSDAMSAILAAAGDEARNRIVANLMQFNRKLATEFAPPRSVAAAGIPDRRAPANDSGIESSSTPLPHDSRPQTPQLPAPPPRAPRIHFDDLVRVERSTLLSALQSVDAEVLVLALSGASDELIERIADQMPRAMGKALRRRICRLGPTRLRDVEVAQWEVAAAAERTLAAKRAPHVALVG